MAEQNQNFEGLMTPAVAPANAERPTDLALSTFAQKIYHSRRARDKKSPMPGLFQDPAWDILLDMFVCHVEHRRNSLTSCALAGMTSLSTGLRWLTTLEDAKLIERKTDRSDGRRSNAFLSPEGVTYMRETLINISAQIHETPQ